MRVRSPLLLAALSAVLSAGTTPAGASGVIRRTIIHGVEATQPRSYGLGIVAIDGSYRIVDNDVMGISTTTGYSFVVYVEDTEQTFVIGNRISGADYGVGGPASGPSTVCRDNTMTAIEHAPMSLACIDAGGNS